MHQNIPVHRSLLKGVSTVQTPQDSASRRILAQSKQVANHSSRPSEMARPELSDSNGRRGGKLFRVGDGEKNPLDTELGGEAGGFAGEGHDGSAQGVGEDLHVSPGDAASPARADHLEDRLLGREATGDEGDGGFVLLGPFLLGGREDAIEEAHTVVLKDNGDAGAFHEVEAVTDYGHSPTLSRGMANVESFGAQDKGQVSKGEWQVVRMSF